MKIANGKKLKCAIPSKGRLSEPSIDLLHRAGYSFRTKGRNLYATCTNADIVFIFVRADDIPVLVESGVVDTGITGNDLIRERNADVTEVMSLGFGHCRLCVAVKDEFQGEDLSAFQGRNIATSFPRITAEFFREKNISINCIEMNGSVEIMVDLKLAEAIVDIVETGDSLRDNNLRVFCDIGNYETVFIANKEIAGNKEIEQIRRRIEGILIADRYSLLEYNISENRFREAEKITPGYESPTVSKLELENWLSVKVMVLKKDVASVMDALEQIGANAIIETSVRNCRL